MPTSLDQQATLGDYAVLSKQIRNAGLLERRRGYYAVRIGLNLLAMAGAWVAFAYIGDSWWQLFVAAFLALVFAQLAFIGHDAGHKQIFRGGRQNNLVGRLHGGLIGMSYGWWNKGHNRHHANPNHEHDDPDVNIDALAFTENQARLKTGFLRWMAKHQAYLFFPLLLLEGLNLHISSVRAIWNGEVKSRKIDGALLVLHFALYLGAVFLVLSPGIAVVFLVVHQGLWGVYMGCSFAPNHKGMPSPSEEDSKDFLRKQVLTSRNVRGGFWVDLALGGLNYQIEHHLFPHMPRPNLRKAQPIVQQFCLERGIPYAQCGLLRSYRYVLEHLHEVGAPLRAPATAPAAA
ncbi:fatty acid desaturase family protein [Amycolatopsis magusensis]|uniref:Fatty acid desaturase n=1 Tax=Amycolatopsis magusensis TaxID=882444 RepID=A0ABS4PT63_9PSEU|nr:acyl-CoA desaturase [Amycolatopsis magusensis]MBP2182060.1 fatty acid desaturase [Amycolatopsis magusensis]MDI5977183.1 acyl-CoA desaturase [Amycolatopsis magusensis]